MSRLPNLSSLNHPADPNTPTTPFQSFAVDSFNVHRLIISAVTVASKFFSDIFYTNSRYAKVGGLPLAELNALELQFLLLNAFDLTVPMEQIQLYGDHLLSFNSLPPVELVEFPHKASPHQSLPEQSVDVGSRRESVMSQVQHLSTVPICSDAPSDSPAASRPKTSFRSASESSTSASESSTVVPSEDSVSTQRAGDEEVEREEDDEEHAEGASQRQPGFEGQAVQQSSPAPRRGSTATAKEASQQRAQQRRDNSRTREWTKSQQTQNVSPATSFESPSSQHIEDAEMHTEED